ncbi:MAG: glycosyltransferase family protein [Lachnospiraceae bacterium]|nr:glycosyltransferase family protein [Lachnospiraceae bacterium]
MDDKKFCFIICTDREEYLKECTYYISHLRIPDGYSAELLPIRECRSMASGYNEGMAASDAKYKIYMHQDVFILNPNFLKDLLMVFSTDKHIGMVGMLGVERLSPDAVVWNSIRVGNVYDPAQEQPDYAFYSWHPEEGVTDVEYAEGMLLATNRDLRWREDLFDGWSFYDASQGFEFRTHGYRVVVPEQRIPWVAHEDSIVNVFAYDKYRKIFMREYMGVTE